MKSGAYEEALKSINNRVMVESLACPPFVELVEVGISKVKWRMKL